MNEIDLRLIQSSPNPVRKTWDEDKMNELAASIAEQGVIVPVKVRPLDRPRPFYPLGNDARMRDHEAQAELRERGEGHYFYELVYGHRRVEAARRANLESIPAIVEGVDDTDALVQALIENVVREGMHDAEQGEGFRRLRDSHGMEMDAIATATGKSSRHIRDCIQLVEDAAAAPFVRDHAVRDAAQKATAIRARLRDNPETAAAVAEKAISEELSTPTIRKMAEAVAAAPTPEIRDRLLSTPYSPFTHDAATVRESPELYTENVQKRADDDWKRTPALNQIVRWSIETTRAVESFRESEALGKLPPEACRFIALKLRRTVDALLGWIEELEAKHG